MNEKLQIRAARSEDKETILEFSQHTWEWGDYLPQVWESWLTDTRGKLLVATIDEQPVAVAHVKLTSDEEGWLEGMRVAPENRERYIATELSKYCLNVAEELGARVAHFVTSSANAPVHHIATKLVFQKVGSFVPYQAKAEDIPFALTVEGPDFLENILALLTNSEVYAAARGLYWHHWNCYTLTREELAKRLDAGEILSLRGDDGMALAIVSKDHPEGGLAIDYIDGPRQSIAELARVLKGYCLRESLPQVSTLLSMKGYPPCAPEQGLA